MNADSHGEMILCKSGLSFTTNSLEMILETTLQRLIGQKLLTVVGLEVFGISTTRELLASLGKLPSMKKDITA